MNNLKAPIVVFVIGTIASFYFGEPGAIVFVAAFAYCGYMINKAGN